MGKLVRFAQDIQLIQIHILHALRKLHGQYPVDANQSFLKIAKAGFKDLDSLAQVEDQLYLFGSQSI
jgi:hypothetical protein